MSNVAALLGKKTKTPIAVNRKVTPIRRQNKDLRPRECLNPDQVDRLMAATAKAGRYGHRDATFILLTYRHDLRVTELAQSKCVRVFRIPFRNGSRHRFIATARNRPMGLKGSSNVTATHVRLRTALNDPKPSQPPLGSGRSTEGKQTIG